MTDIVTTQTPLRISFFGGGTDFPEWYLENGGATLSTTINKFCNIVCVPSYPFYDYKYRIVYSDIEVANNIEAIKHPVVRETLKTYPKIENIEIHYSGDLPAGTGLGTSSAFTVGMINALNTFTGKTSTSMELARGAVDLERNKLNEVVGCQDQIAAAFGGLNLIEYSQDDQWKVHPVEISKNRNQELQDHLMLFFSGIKRRSSTVASSIVQKMGDSKSQLRDMQQLVHEAHAHLINDNQSILEFGRLLNLNWQLKKSLSQMISNDVVDNMYSKAIQAGALGGKILGAGGGGFLLLFVEPHKQALVADALKAFKQVDFQFEPEGSRVIVQNKEDGGAPFRIDKVETKKEIH